MIRKLRKQIFWTIVISFGTVVSFIMLIINMLNYRHFERLSKKSTVMHNMKNINYRGNQPTVISPELLLWVSIVIVVCLMAVIVILAIFLSRKIVKPVEESFLKQQQFISDASHELKTPLAVILSNVELLEMEQQPNKWTNYIHTEAQRMKKLLEHMLTLARMEQTQSDIQKNTFSISNVVTGVALPFEGIAYEQGISYEMHIIDSIMYEGQEEEIKQLTAILLDNAMEHTEKGKQVVVELEQNQHNKISLAVRNMGNPISQEEQKMLFERFYRGDKSRNSRQERFGLGLAIAKSIVERHGGKIRVVSENGWNSFEVLL